jgi:RimJ/RimL family protein N-acetyltransferase
MVDRADAPIRLLEIVDADFDWLLNAHAAGYRGLRLPPGGVDDASTLAIVRRIIRRLHAEQCRGAWLIVSRDETDNDEVVGLCSYRRPPVDGRVEIGYGVAASRRGLGHATRAVALLAGFARADGLRELRAETAITNMASSRVLAKNDFVPFGTRTDERDGQVVMWKRPLGAGLDA